MTERQGEIGLFCHLKPGDWEEGAVATLQMSTSATPIARGGDDTLRRELDELRREVARWRAIGGTEAALLYELLDAINRAATIDDVYAVGLAVVGRALDVERSSILLFDEEAVMRFRAWRGLSDTYRSAVEGHSPWSADTRDATPIFVHDVRTDADLRPYLPTFERENILALGFIPLVHQGRLIGKFMVYSDRARTFTRAEIRLVETIAAQVASGVVRKRSESELREAQVAAEQASRMKDEFLAVVSHELRTPLSTISGWVSLLRKARRDDLELIDKGLEVIARNVHAQTTIIEDILDVSRIITGNLVLEPQVVSVVTVVEEAIESARMSATAKRIELSLEKEEGPFTVVGDPDRLRQVVWNLLSNAIKFTPVEGGVRVRIHRELGNVNIAVIDSGRGIDGAFLPFVFDRFRQADSTTTRRHTGLGLGLAIVRHLVELHGGDVRAASPGPGRGATFTISLPVRAVFRRAEQQARPSPQTPTGAAPSSTVRLDGIRVLVVDDDPDAREMLSEILASYGASPRVADSAASGLRAIIDFSPHVLVSDIGMPEEDGTSLVRRLRSEVPGGDVMPAVALTAYARREEAARALRSGFDHHLAKPANPEVLVSLIRTLADRGR